MRRMVWCLIVVLSALALYSPPAIAGTQHEPCATLNPKPRWGHDKVAAAVHHCIVVAEDRWSTPGGASCASSIAYSESRYWPWAYNGSYAGVYQQSTAYWRGRADQFLEHRWFPHNWYAIRHHGWFSAKANVLMSIRMMHSGGLGPWGGGC